MGLALALLLIEAGFGVIIEAVAGIAGEFDVDPRDLFHGGDRRLGNLQGRNGVALQGVAPLFADLGDGFAVDKVAVLHAPGVCPLLILIEGGGAVDQAVYVVHAPVGHGGLAGLAAAEMDENGIVRVGQVGVVVAYAADGAGIGNGVKVGKNRHHPGDAALGDDLIDHVGGGKAPVGDRRVDVVDHNGHRPPSHGGFRVVGLAGQGVPGTGGLRFGLGLRL